MMSSGGLVLTASQGDLDWVIVRENSEGEYAGQGGRTHTGYDWEVGTGRSSSQLVIALLT
jgi:isocitrate/isopropylmalate dehydrogenase